MRQSKIYEGISEFIMYILQKVRPELQWLGRSSRDFFHDCVCEDCFIGNDSAGRRGFLGSKWFDSFSGDYPLVIGKQCFLGLR